MDANAVNLDELNQAMKDNPDDLKPQIELWTAVAKLSEWVFINRGTAEQPSPFAIAGENGPILCIYSTPDRAAAAAIANGLVAEGEAPTFFSVPLPAGIDWALSLGAVGITAATIDYPAIGAWTPLSNLSILRAQLF